MSLTDHDDFGLHRDLLAIGRKVGRPPAHARRRHRRQLRRAPADGLWRRQSQLSSTTTGTTGTTGTGTTGGGAVCAEGAEKPPARFRRRLERPERAAADRRGAQRHQVQLRGHERNGRWRAADDCAHLVSSTCARWPAAPSTSGTAIGSAATRSTTAASPAEPLRGVQERTAAGGSFTSIFPACHAGRWRTSTSRSTRRCGAERDQQGGHLADALPKTSCDEVYAAWLSEVRNLAQVSLASDMVFSDGASLELATMTGSVAGGPPPR